MKCINRILSVMLLISAFSMANGQNKLKFNVHAGPQFCWFGSDDDSIQPDGSILNFQAGLQMDYYFQENYAFYLGFRTNNLGGKLHYLKSEEYISNEDTISIGPDQGAKVTVNYLDIPVGLKLQTEEMGYLTIFIQGGFNPMFRVNAKVSSEEGNLDKDSFKNSVRLFNLGYHVGAGAKYRLGGTTALLGGVSWSAGLIDVMDLDGANTTVRAISINLGLVF